MSTDNYPNDRRFAPAKERIEATPAKDTGCGAGGTLKIEPKTIKFTIPDGEQKEFIPKPEPKVYNLPESNEPGAIKSVTIMPEGSTFEDLNNHETKS